MAKEQKSQMRKQVELKIHEFVEWLVSNNWQISQAFEENAKSYVSLGLKLQRFSHTGEMQGRIHWYKDNEDIYGTEQGVQMKLQPFQEIEKELDRKVAESMRSKIRKLEEEKTQRNDEIKAEDATKGVI